MASREEVVFCYRFLMGRDPESDEVIAQYMDALPNWRKLRELFMASPEFLTRLQDTAAPRAGKLPPSSPPMQVELDADPDRLAALFAKTQSQWQHLGDTEPHWSVLTHDSYRQENFEQNRNSFYASGEGAVRGLEATLARAGLSINPEQVCLELGCGTGRATASLAERYNKVIAVDISAAHLALARLHVGRVGRHNVVTQHLQTVESIGGLGQFDVLFSQLVLQHNSPPVMAYLLRTLLGQMNPGGLALLQVPTYQAGYRFSIDQYLAERNATQMELHFYPQGPLLRLFEQAGMELLEVREDDSIGISATAISNTFLLRKQR